MYVVVAQRQIDAPPELLWAYLTEPAKLSLWFADPVNFKPGADFTLAFGDGDFFAGRVLEWEPEIYLSLSWRFCDLGPRYEVVISLLRRKGGTEVSLQDRGALTIEEAECLRVGWSEFLMRLETAVRSSTSARFSWRKAITFTGNMPARPAPLAETLRRPEWYVRIFEGARVRGLGKGSEAEPLCGRLAHPDWAGEETVFEIRPRDIAGSHFLFLSHTGWNRMPPEVGEAARREAVTRWITGLGALGVK